MRRVVVTWSMRIVRRTTCADCLTGSRGKVDEIGPITHAPITQFPSSLAVSLVSQMAELPLVPTACPTARVDDPVSKIADTV